MADLTPEQVALVQEIIASLGIAPAHGRIEA